MEALGNWGSVVDGLQREAWMQDQDVQLCLELSYGRNQFFPMTVLNTVLPSPRVLKVSCLS